MHTASRLTKAFVFHRENIWSAAAHLSENSKMMQLWDWAATSVTDRKKGLKKVKPRAQKDPRTDHRSDHISTVWGSAQKQAPAPKMEMKKTVVKNLQVWISQRNAAWMKTRLWGSSCSESDAHDDYLTAEELKCKEEEKKQKSLSPKYN